MSWQDDLETRVKSAAQNIGGDIQAYIQARVVDPVVKVGQPAKGNLSAAELARGAKGENPDASIASESSAVPGTINGGFDFKKYILPAVAVVAVLLLLKSKRRA